MNKKIGIMITGGLDSTVLLYWLLKNQTEIVPIYINYGQHSYLKEREVLSEVIPKKLIGNLNIISLQNIFSNSESRLIVEPNLWKDEINDSDLFLPYRNMLLISSALAFCASNSINYVYAGFISTNDVKEIDSTQEFLDSLQSYSNNFGNVQLVTPFKDKTKSDIWKLGVELNAPIHLTFSCQAKPKTPCGACPNCVERNKAFKTMFK